MITRKTGGKRIRKLKELQRKSLQISERPVILIVTEGITEERYFKALRTDLRINAKVEISKSKYGTDPKSVVEYAKYLSRKEKQYGDIYDKTWCVYDRDEHQKFKDANIQARDLKFEVAFSNPCFELWYLIHFQNQEAHIERDEVVENLKQYIPDYDKTKDCYEKLKKYQNDAIVHAEKLREKHKRENSEETKNPSTTVDLLVKYLNSISNS